MFDHHQKTVGSYTTSVACLAAAVFIAAVLFALRPFGYETFALAAASTAVCVALAWTDWKRVAK